MLKMLKTKIFKIAGSSGYIKTGMQSLQGFARTMLINLV